MTKADVLFELLDGLPLPPDEMRVGVTSTADPVWFLESGRNAARQIAELAKKHGAPLDGKCAVLDFGCGCGRVLRHLRPKKGISTFFGPSKNVLIPFFGVDPDETFIRWNRASLPFARFSVNDPDPPLAFDDASFDFIYALSVFTHLTEERQHGWMGEMVRILRPGGLLLLTTHGSHYLDKLTATERERFDRGEIVVHSEERSGSNWCAAFHPPSYVTGRLAGGLTLLETIPEGAAGNPRQDLYLFRK